MKKRKRISDHVAHNKEVDRHNKKAGEINSNISRGIKIFVTASIFLMIWASLGDIIQEQLGKPIFFVGLFGVPLILLLTFIRIQRTINNIKYNSGKKFGSEKMKLKLERRAKRSGHL